jgi:hypothetical protein
MQRPLVLSLLLALGGAAPLSAQQSGDTAPTLRTRWAADVDPANVLPAYPRPHLRRERWINLNGAWEYAIADSTATLPAVFDGTVIVPFPIESQLSGVTRAVTPRQRVWYRRTFELDTHAAGERWLLHFGAVDWETRVWVNGHELGSHRGGYDPFSFDATDALTDAGPQEMVVSVCGTAGDGRIRVGSDRRGRAAARQTGARPARDLVHRGHRDLADGVARAGPGGPRDRPARRAEPC